MVQGTYQNNPSFNDIDRVRFLAQDTSEPFFLSDSEINYLMEVSGNPESAAADAAEVIAGKLSVRADKTVGPFSIRYSEQSASYMALSTKLRSRLSRYGTVDGPILTQVDREPYFKLGQMDAINLTDPKLGS